MQKVKNYTYTIIFCFLTIVLGFLSCRKLIHFYVDQELDYNDWTPELGTKFETDIASTFYNKFGFVNLNGAISSLLNQPSMHGIYKLNNGHLTILQDRLPDEEIKASAGEVIKYADYCKSQGKQVLFVQPFLKIDKDNKQLRTGLEDYSNENIDVFLDCLTKSGITVLDIRKCMKEDGLDMYDYTYITDHHWTTEGSFYSFVKITEWIEQNMGVAADPNVTDFDQYSIIKYPKWHLGSYGQRTGKYYAGIDDYDLIIPDFDAGFIDDNGTEYSFYDAVVNQKVFEKRKETNKYTYDYALICPEGTSTTGKPLSVLFVTDSYAFAMAPYVKLAYTDYHDQFYYKGFDPKLVDEFDPDIVILMPFYYSIFSQGAVYLEQ